VGRRQSLQGRLIREDELIIEERGRAGCVNFERTLGVLVGCLVKEAPFYTAHQGWLQNGVEFSIMLTSKTRANLVMVYAS
jgi:hypothetical protein